MAWTKPTFYITLIFLAVVFFTGLVNVGVELAGDSNHNLSPASLDYINGLKGDSDSNGFAVIEGTDVTVSRGTDILSEDNTSQVSTSNDFLDTLFIKQERASKPVKFLNVVYNIPTSIMLGLGVPVEPFNNVINILAYVLLIALVITVWTKLINA